MTVWRPFARDINALLRQILNDSIRSVDESDKLLRAAWNMDEKAVAEGIRKAHLETSHLQYNDENALPQNPMPIKIQK